MSTISTLPSVNVQTRIGTLRFKQVNARRFVVRCKGMARIRIVADRNGEWEATTVPPTENRHGVETVAVGKSPKQCYSNAVKSFWN